MKILLLGEYSNVHATLAEGLRALGHQVTVASNGDFWKNYPRDIDLARRPGKLGGIRLLLKVWRQLPRWRGYDVVQLINPIFLELRAERLFPIYRYLRRHNRHVVLGAMGMDYYWVNECITRKPLRYSDFNIGPELRTDACALKEQADWLGTAKERLNHLIATDCDAIVAVLYEYYVCYQPHFPEKLRYIPLPIKLRDESLELRDESLELRDESLELRDESLESRDESLELSVERLQSYKTKVAQLSTLHSQLKLFIGISRGRSQYKGTDIMLRAAEAVRAKYPERLEIVKAEGVPFAEYQRMMDGCDALLDQLYSYTPSMNSLLAMSKGIVIVGGGEPEHYALLGETQLRPIVNVEPTYDSVCHELEQLVLHPERLPELKRQSMEYVSRHHDYLTVAAQYESLYKKLCFPH